MSAGTLLVTLSDNHSGSSSSSGGSSSNVAAMGGNSIHSLAGGAVLNSSIAPAAFNSTVAAAANNTALVTPASAGTGASHSVLGDLLCLLSASFYACYTIVLRKSLPDDDEANVALFFGYVGVLCSVVFAPVVAILAGIGSMHLKSIPPKAYLIILIEGEGSMQLVCYRAIATWQQHPYTVCSSACS
jgi:drug/metabolite transporter (DMT)-like permease